MWNNIWTNLFFLVCLGIQIWFTAQAIWRWYKVDLPKIELNQEQMDFLIQAMLAKSED